ncbi:MAG: xylose isomerase [Chloroflexota bacterium]|nr:sugar phosphate isomerase/epimerase [Caldilinea sp.]GIK71754.1 MAG: xylose isomerase [Chloroflexota bacterium]
MIKHAIITSFLGRTKDRFHEYNEPKTLAEKFAMINAIPSASGVEVVYPYEVESPETTGSLARVHGLQFAAINANVKAEPEFRNGGLTSPDKHVRTKAVRIIKEAKDFAVAVGANKVTCCPLSDGYEFSFQSDYAVAWRRLIDSFGEAADYRREIPLFIEYKPSETRGACFLNNAAKTLLLLKEIGIPQLGVTLDFGHSIYGGNNPAEELVLLAESGHPYYLHINDNDGRWDWDYFCGAKHILEYAEFIYYARRYNYQDYFTSDTSPTRWDICATFEANGRITNKLWRLFDQLESQGFAQVIGNDNFLKTWQFIEENLFSLR